MVGLAMAGLPAQATGSGPPAVTASAPDSAAFSLPSTCPVTNAQFQAALNQAIKAVPKLTAGGLADPVACKLYLMVRPDRLTDAIAKLNATAGLRALRTGQTMPPSTPASIVVEVTPSGKACTLQWPPVPCGWEFQQIALSPDMTGNGFGEILAVDDKANLFRHSFKVGNKLDRQAYLSGGWRGAKVYAPGDWNGDGKADLMRVDKAGRMYLYPGNGKGDIGHGMEIGHGWSKLTVIPAGDLTGDKIPDMLAINNTTGVLLMYAGNGKGGFKPGNKQVGHGWKGMQLFAAGDMNKDGKTDILGLKSDGRLFYYAGRGNGNFQPAVQVGHGWTGMTLAAGADLDGDGKADIVGRTKNGDLLFYRGGGIGTFAKPVRIATDW